jgi:hypothetical protein
MLLVFTGSLTLNIYLEVQTGVSRLPVKTSNIIGNTSLDFQVEVQGKASCKN